MKTWQDFNNAADIHKHLPQLKLTDADYQVMLDYEEHLLVLDADALDLDEVDEDLCRMIENGELPEV